MLNSDFKNFLISELNTIFQKSTSILNETVVSGGSINSAYKINLKNHNPLFLKINHRRLAFMFQTEYHALKEIENTETISVPKAISYGVFKECSYLLLSWVSFSSPNSNGWKNLGQQLAHLHLHQRKQFGWQHDNVIGSTKQLNSFSNNWVDFFIEKRLDFQIGLAKKNGLSVDNREALFQSFKNLFNSYEPKASLIHGDLWSGNVAFDHNQKPYIFDPAFHYGDRECDLAMTELFGGFSNDFYNSYHLTYPLDHNYQTRKEYYQLYHILNHYNLFGGGYGNQALTLIQRLISTH